MREEIDEYSEVSLDYQKAFWDLLKHLNLKVYQHTDEYNCLVCYEFEQIEESNDQAK